MPTTKYDITVQQGATFILSIQARDSTGAILSLVGFTGDMQVRKSASDGTILMEASTANGRLTINGPGGVVTISVPAATTDAMTWESGVWDCEVTGPTGIIYRIAEGFAALSPEVTR